MTDLASDWSVGPRLTDQSAESAPLGTQKQAIIIKIFTIFTQSTVLQFYILAVHVRHTTYATCNMIFTQSTGIISLHVTVYVETYFSAQSAVRLAPAPSTWPRWEWWDLAAGLSPSVPWLRRRYSCSQMISRSPVREGGREEKRVGVTIVLYSNVCVRDLLTGGEKG